MRLHANNLCLKKPWAAFGKPALEHKLRFSISNSFLFKATGAQLGIIVSAISSLGSALIIAFYFGWKLACVVVVFLPMIVVSGLIQARLMTGSARKDKVSMEEAAGVRFILINKSATKVIF